MVGEKMKKALHKEFWMEIRKSKARFISIFLIVALGVAFFSGIQAASPDMRYSGDAYYDESNLMDLKVMGTMGLTEQDVSALKNVDGVETAEGAYSTDVLLGGSDAVQVLHVESLNEEVNQVTVSEGRLPERSGECFLDKEFADSGDYKVGDTITVVQDGDSELLKKETFTVTGLGSSPLYISFSRGNTTLGSGEINGFMYVLPEDFDQEVYTQIYIRIHEAEELISYTDAYDNLVDKIQDRVEGIQEVQCQARYQEVVSDAQKEIDDARKELEDGKQEAEQELADAREQLEQAEEELADGRQEYEDGVQQLESAREELADGRQQLADAREQVADGWAQLETARQQAASGYEELESARSELESGWAQFNDYQAQTDDGYAQLNEAKEQYREGRQEIQNARELLEQRQQEVNAGLAQIEEGRAQLSSQESQLNANRQECVDGLSSVEAGETQLAGAQAQLETAQAELAARQAEYEAAEASGNYSQEELEAMHAELTAYEEEVNAQAAAVESERQRLSALRSELETNLAQIDQGLAQIQQSREELSQQESQLAQGQAQITEGLAQLESRQAQLAQARQQIQESQAALDEAQAELDATRRTLEAGQAEYDAGLAEYQSGQAQIAQSEATLAQSEQEIQENAQRMEEGEQEIQENEQTLEDARQEIEDGERELEDGRRDYEDGRREAEQEIQDGEKEIEDAQKELDDLEEPEWMLSTRADLPEYSDYGDNADRIRNIGEVFPVMFFLVAALISLTTMTRMVEEQRTQIGTMKALGYGKYDIASKYLNYAFLATVGGSIFGVLIGQKLLPYIIIQAYGIMYHNMASSMQIHYELSYALIASVAAVVCTMGATLFSCYKELAETPAALMRPPAPKEGKRVLVERVAFIWKRMNFSWKSSLRNLFRYKKRLFMTIFGIAGSMALLVVGFGIRDSIMDIAVRQYEELQHYEGMIIDDEDATDGEREELLAYLEGNEKIDHYTRVQLLAMTVPTEKSNLSVYVYVPENVENFSEDVTLQNRRTKEQYSLTDEGAAVSEKTADMLGLDIGDEITIEKDNEEYKAEIAVITENYMGHYIYMTPAVYEETFGETPEYADIVFSMKEEYTDDLEATGEEILTYPAALSISYTSSIAGQLERMLSSLGAVIVVLIVSAGMLAFVVLYNLNNINITERQRELATLKVLGFYDQEVSQYVFRENILLTLLGVAAGAVLGTFLHQYVITTVEVDAVMFGRNIRPLSFLYSALITCGFSAIVNIVMHFKLKEIDMVESLKSVE
mgnify:CR=1 FL=1